MTKAPIAIMYTNVSCIGMVCIAVMIAALNDLDFKAADILNAYLRASYTEKCGLS